MSEKIIHTKDMTCPACELKLEKALGAVEGVLIIKASYSENLITVDYDKPCTEAKLLSAVEDAGYTVSSGNNNIVNSISLLVIVIGVYVIIQSLSFDSVYRYFPEAKSGMSYAALFIVGLLTSLHCVAMCGGINLTASLGGENNSPILSSVKYNLGRVIGYTAIGAILGGIGSAANFSVKARAILGIAAGTAMLIIGLNMIGCFGFLRKLSIHPPKSLMKKLYGGKKHGAFYIGLLNALMPCGPLQSMQLFAVASGSILGGALSMMFFSLGTIPLMLIFGTLAGTAKNTLKHKMTAAGAALIFVFGLNMIFNNSALIGANVPKISLTENKENTVVSEIKNGTQYVTTELRVNSYTPIKVTNGIPVKWTVIADESTLNGCNSEIVIPEYNISAKLESDETVIEFTPEDTGTFAYTCWMGMIRSSITVS